MRKLYQCFLVGACCAFAASLEAQMGPNVEPFCDPMMRPMECVPDTLEIVFTADNATIFEYPAGMFPQGMVLETTAVSDTKSDMVQGWSYAVAHDAMFVTLDPMTVTTEGTLVDPNAPGSVAMPPHFDVTNAVDSDMDGVLDGWISAVVLSFISQTQLPVNMRNVIAKANYTLTAEPPPAGTQIKYVDNQIGSPGSPPTAINITIGGRARLPENFVQGLIRAAVGKVEICNNMMDDDGDGLIDCMDPNCTDDPACPENCGNMIDDDADGLIDCADVAECPPGVPPCDVVSPCPDWALWFGPAASMTAFDGGGGDIPISMHNMTDAFAFSLGATRNTQGGVTTYTFSGMLGTDATRLVELIITDAAGNSQTPAAGNTATSSADPAMLIIERGAAVRAFDPGDFFAFDTNPGVGGPGFTVGYVSDLDSDTNRIPATAGPMPCVVNEVLVMRFAIPPARFGRGDGNGDGRINVTDAVWIIQIIVGNFMPVYDCRDALDADDDGQAQLNDAVRVLNWIFERGPRLPEPFLACGTDPTADMLSCNQSSPACR